MFVLCTAAAVVLRRVEFPEHKKTHTHTSEVHVSSSTDIFVGGTRAQLRAALGRAGMLPRTACCLHSPTTKPN